MIRKEAWKVRNGNDEDMEAILSLRRLVFGEGEKERLHPKFWEWEFLEGAEGKALINLVENGGRLIGHFADLPRRFSLHSRLVKATLSLDLMVHPDFRRRGIFEAMGRYALERVKEAQGLFLTAFPIRKETIGGLLKMGWKRVVSLPVLVYPNNFTAIVDHFLRRRPLSSLVGDFARYFHLWLYSRGVQGAGMEGTRIEEVDRLDVEFDRFWDKASLLFPKLGVRDRPFLNWRYRQHPFWTYTIYRAMRQREMTGYVILRKVNLLRLNTAVMVDLMALERETLRALVLRAMDYSVRKGAWLLGFMVPRTHPYYRMLRGWGFLPSLKQFWFMIYSHLEEAELFEPQGWYVNWGDTDVI